MVSLRHIAIFAIITLYAVSTTAQTARIKVDKSKTQFCDSVLLKFTNTSEPFTGTTKADYTYVINFGKVKPGMTDDTAKVITADGSFSMWFTRPGKHTVKLRMDRISTGLGNKTDDTIYTFYVRPHPNAWFSVADSFAAGDLTYRFLSGKAATDTILYKYKWVKETKNSSDSTVHIGASNGRRDRLIATYTLEGKHFMYLTVSDALGCTDTYRDSFQVSQKLVIPKAFSPNEDGINDVFEVETNGRTTYSFQVFTSGGSLIFKSVSKSIIWDGYTLNGQLAIPGTYFYYIASTSPGTNSKEAGYLMLFREKK